ncbi:MAG: hypothetical protein WED00_17490 [Aquisalimonadaceae bacterium]
MMYVVNFIRYPLMAVLTAALLVSGGIAMGQGQAPAPAPGQGQGQGQGDGAQMELQQLQQRLAQIQQQAFENNPELQEQAQALETLFISTMADAGYDPEGGLARLREIQGEMRNEATADERRQELLQEAQQIQTELQEGQQVAMQEQVIIDAQEDFEEDLMDAMRAEDPETDDLIARFEQVQQQMQPQQ